MAGVGDAVAHDSAVAVDVVGLARECGHSLDAHVGPNEIVADVMPLYPTCRLHLTSERPGE